MADVFVDIVKSIKTSKDEENKTIKLVANSGIQFVDFEFDGLIDFESDDKDIYPKHIVKGQFVKHPKYADHYARFREDKLNECLRVDDFETAINIGSEYRTEEDRDDTGVSMLDSLHLYNVYGSLFLILARIKMTLLLTGQEQESLTNLM